MVCASCGHENREGASFCVSCGSRLAASCSNCSAELQASARFCDSCGTATGDTPEAQASEEQAASPMTPGSAPSPEELAETIEFLGKLAIFQLLPRDGLERLADQMRVVPLPEGPVFKENDPVDGLYIVKSGTAKVTKGGAGMEAVLAIHGQGDSFGEIGLIDGLPRSADVTAMQPMECYFLGRDSFLAALDQHPELARSMLLSLAGMVRNADEWVARAF